MDFPRVVPSRHLKESDPRFPCMAASNELQVIDSLRSMKKPLRCVLQFHRWRLMTNDGVSSTRHANVAVPTGTSPQWPALLGGDS
jgi:hypothetical protein